MEQAQTQAAAVHARFNRYFALLAFGIAFATYVSTVAPTSAFWDCGEYIAAGHSLGIPHPPGNPLYVMMSRVFSILLFFLEQVALRINMISVLSGAFVVMFIYLIGVRVSVGWMGIPDTAWKRATVYVGGLVGALFAGFGNTFWFSCVEAEVNVVSMLFVVVSSWVALVWSQSKDPNRDRLLVLVSYLVFLGIGVHMFSMVAIAPVALFVVLSDKQKLQDWRLWIAAILLFSAMYSMSLFLVAAPLLVVMAAVYAFMNYKDSRAVNVGIFVLAVVVRAVIDFQAMSRNESNFGELVQNSVPFVLLLVLAIVELMNDNPAQAFAFRARWRFIFWISLMALLGYSVHLYIPIRSSLHPMIDENHPATWDAFKQFLERKQYGSENMVLRMFHRRGAWNRQFGIDSNMGFGGFHITQFFHFGPSYATDRTTSLFVTWGLLGGWLRLVVYLIPTGFMLFGWYYLWKRARNLAVLLITLVLMGTVALVLYMNFADGTRMERYEYEYWQRSIRHAMSQGMSRAEAEARIQKPPPVHREVRERDYFFTPGFMWLGLWMGVSATCLLHLLFVSRIRWLRTVAAPIGVVLFGVSPALPFFSNYAESSRRGDWVPYDYAYNLLMSCDKDAVLFTNGDNDTFPLWFLQEAVGIRKDVRVVNLSLLNTHWYILQLKHIEPKVAISYSDEECHRLTHDRNPFEKDSKVRLQQTKLEVVVPGRERQPALKVQDKMVLNIVDANNWRKPIYMAVTVSQDNFMGLDPYLSMEGLVYRVNPQPVPPERRIDVDRTIYFLEKVYRYRSLGVPGVHLNETTQKLLGNYSAGYLYVAYTLRDELARLKAEAERLGREVAAGGASDSLRQALVRAEAEYREKLDLVVGKLDECVSLMPWDWRPRVIRHQTLLTHGRVEDAGRRAREALLIDPSFSEYKKMLVEVYEATGKSDSANALLRDLLDEDRDPWNAYVALAQNYAQAGQFDSAIECMKRFQESHPGDQRAASLISYFESRKAAAGKQDS